MSKFIRVFFVDIFSLVVGLVMNFYLPKLFSIEEYSLFRTFGLYILFSGMIHLGFTDGIYLKLGGLREEEVNKGQVKKYFYLLVSAISCISLVLFGVAYFVGEFTFTAFVLYTLPYQVVLFFQMYHRAIGVLNRYSFTQAIINVFNLLSIVLLIFVFPIKEAKVIIYLQVGTQYVVAIALVVWFLWKNKEGNKSYSPAQGEIMDLCKVGFTVMIANSISLVLLSLDRWVIKIFFDDTQFAYYSFAISVVGLFLLLINSMTIIAYPYIARMKGNTEYYQRFKTYILIVCSCMPLGYYILEMIVKVYLPHYIQSMEYVFILLLTLPFNAVVTILYSNMYKVNNQSKQYLFVTVKMLVISLILNVTTVFIFKEPVTVSIATVITYMIWYVYSSKDFPMLSVTVKEALFLLINIGVFIAAYIGITSNIVAFIVATVFILINIVAFYRQDILLGVKQFKEMKTVQGK